MFQQMSGRQTASKGFLMDISDQIQRVLIASSLQIAVGIIVLFFTLCIANAMQRFVFRTMASAIGLRPLVYSTGWIGSPVHEFSHLVVLLIFRIKVIAFKPFSPDFKNGHLGYVISAPNPQNPLHSLGFALSGIAPVIGGISLILLLGLVLLPGLDRAISEMAITSIDEETASVHGYLYIVAGTTYDGIRILIDPKNLGRWQFWVFLYVASCVLCHFAPSSQDMHGIGPGLAVLIALVFIGNGTAACMGFDPMDYTFYWGKCLGVVLGLLGIAFGIGLANCLASQIVVVPIRILR
jgi:hypothetical protein